MLQLALLALLTQTPQHRLFLQPNLPRVPVFEFELVAEYSFAAAQGALPSAVDATNLVALCKVNSGGTAWECVDANGASFGTVTPGTGTTFDNTPFGVKAMSDITSAKAPRVVSTSLDSIFKADHTIVMVGYATTLTDSNFQHWFGFSDGTNLAYFRNESGSFHCVWSGAGGARDASNGTPSVTNGWAVTSCRRSGNDHTARVNGTASLAVSGASISGDVTATTPYYMGDRQTAGLPMRGPLAWIAFYSDDLSDARLLALEKAWWGLPSGVTATLGTGGVCADFDGGQNDCYLLGAMAVGPAGILHTRGDTLTSTWAADALAAGGWTDVGTPTVTANSANGVFYRWRSNTAQADLIEDNDGAAFEGKQGANGRVVRDTMYTAHCYLAAGTAGTTTTKARLRIDVTDGTFAGGATSYACDFSDLTSTPVRKTCTTPVYSDSGASPTVRGSVLVGNAASDTGSITVSHCGMNSTGWVEQPVLENAAKGNGSISLDPSAWPSVALGGKYEVVFTPTYDPNTQWSTQADALYLFDGNDGSNHSVVIIPSGYSTAGRLLARTQNGASDQTEFTIDEVSFTAGQLYAISMEWEPTGATCTVRLRYDSCSGPASTCHAITVRGETLGGICPSQPTAARLGNRFDSSVPTSVWVSAMRVYQ